MNHQAKAELCKFSEHHCQCNHYADRLNTDLVQLLWHQSVRCLQHPVQLMLVRLRSRPPLPHQPSTTPTLWTAIQARVFHTMSHLASMHLTTRNSTASEPLFYNHRLTNHCWFAIRKCTGAAVCEIIKHSSRNLLMFSFSYSTNRKWSLNWWRCCVGNWQTKCHHMHMHHNCFYKIWTPSDHRQYMNLHYEYMYYAAYCISLLHLIECWTRTVSQMTLWEHAEIQSWLALADIVIIFSVLMHSGALLPAHSTVWRKPAAPLLGPSLVSHVCTSLMFNAQQHQLQCHVALQYFSQFMVLTF